MRLSVLDQSPVPEGLTGADALANTLDLAQAADAAGYHRYWVAEHHGGTMLAGPSPEALIGPIAERTSRIRVGSGGVMLPHYSPFKVAETFSVLCGLYPGRIDLGIGRAAGTDPMTTFALQRDRRQAAPDDFPQQISELIGYLDGTLPDDHPFRRLDLPSPERPELWMLGSSPQSAVWASQLGLPYSFADFINPEGAEIATLYRQQGGERTMVCVWALCAETDEEAVALATSSQMAMRLLRRGRLIAIPPVEKAVRFLESEGKAPAPAGRGRRMVLGAPETVKAGLEEIAAEYGAEETMVVGITHDHAARRRSYELIAEAFGLYDSGKAPSSSARERAASS